MVRAVVRANRKDKSKVTEDFQTTCQLKKEQLVCEVLPGW